MCLLVLFYRAVEDAPVVIGANREEAYSRGGEPPSLLEGSPRIVAGIDPVAGGTWLGVNQYGVAIAITNRRKTQEPSYPRSRGLLARDLLASRSAVSAAEQVTRSLESGNYAGCNVLCADLERAVVVQAGDWLRVRPLPSGLHVLSNGDVNDEGDRRVGHALWRLGQQKFATGIDCLSALEKLCAETGPPEAPICFRGPERGTVSSTLLALRRPLARGTLLHAQGSPDRVAYADRSELLRQLDPEPLNGAAKRKGE